MRIEDRALVVLVGPSGSGKSTWAARRFRPEQIVSSDTLRGIVGETPADQRASPDAFDVLDRIVAARLRRGLLTVVDATNLEDDRRARLRELARTHEVPLVAVTFATDAATCRRRNAERRFPVPARVLAQQQRRMREVLPLLADEGFDAVSAAPEDVAVVPRAFLRADDLLRRQRETPMTMRFGLSIPRFDFAPPEELGPRLAAIAQAAEAAGFDSIWVMDHMIQIPPIGPAWDPMLEGYTTLSYLAAATSRIRLGLAVGAVTYRNPALVGKIVATLDVLSGGRAWCGLGAAWFGREHAAYGWTFPDLPERYAQLEDALELLPLLWGPGTPAYRGRAIEVAEAICYPRPLQQPHPPILVGGVGERRTLRLVAQHAQACNLPGDAELVRRKVAVLHAHCAELGRDPSEVTVTQLGPALVASDREALAQQVEARRASDEAPETYARRVNAGTIEDQIGRFRDLAEAGVDLAIVSLPDLAGPDEVSRFTPIVAAFG